MITQLGAYWDDWPSIWFLHSFGPGIFPTAFHADRPLQGWLFVLTTSLLGQSMLAWQVFGIFTRFLSGVALMGLLAAIWPGRTFQNTAVVLLFLLYPGFTHQYIPITYSHQFIVQAVFFLSLAAMVWACRKPDWFWPLTVFALVSSILCMFTLEYFVGLELLRPVLLWLANEGTEKDMWTRLKWVLKRWLPYLAVLAFFVVWRVTHKTPRGDVIIFDNLRNNPVTTIVELIKTILRDIYNTSILAWAKTFNFSNLNGTKTYVVALYIGVSIIAATLVILLLVKIGQRTSVEEKRKPVSSRQWAVQAIVIGLYSLAISGWPIWVTNLHIELEFPWDRFTLAMMLGTSLILVGLIELITRTYLQAAILVGIAAGLAAGMHTLVGVSYRQDWTLQRSLFWQMSWRVPGIEPGTAILSPYLPFQYVTDNSLTAPVNWMYAPDSKSIQMPYALLTIDARLGNLLPNLEKGTPISVPYRATTFSGSTSQALVMVYDPPRCLKIFDPAIDTLWPNKPNYLDQALQLSRPELIRTGAAPAASPPAGIFGPEPEHDWCYYFEKADLALQTGKWEAVANLGDQARVMDKKFSKETVAEAVPFIEGYAYMGQWQNALQLSQEMYKTQNKTQGLLCLVWKNLLQSTIGNPDRQAATNQIQNQLRCEHP